MSLLFDIFVLAPILILTKKADEINKKRERDASMECLAFDALNQQAEYRQDRRGNYKYEDPDLDDTMNDNGPDW